ncbi:hypothetical protein SDC9_127984 [bioreactor metagenome]|uniref:SGNH hydrolase-type esterase domain-containing protein n=1 Tax=bioreactor metagenome TaxID=1076179 RepID=A0A645CVM1_9ZZZZ
MPCKSLQLSWVYRKIIMKVGESFVVFYKKWMTILLVVLMLLSLSACNTPKQLPVDDPYTPVVTPKPDPKPNPVPEPVIPNDEISEQPSSPNDEKVVEQPAKGLQATNPVSDDYFNDVVLIGDSVTLKLYYYLLDRWNTDESYLGDIQFLTAGSLGSGNALWEVSEESVHPTFQGEKMLLEDSIKLSGAKKVYLMLGTNDVGLYGVETAVENYNTLLNRILSKNPGVAFYIQSALPMYRKAQLPDLNNQALLEYNQKLYALALERGDYFVDVASIMQTEDHSLPYQYCSDPDDMGIHLTDIACEKWISYLRTHVAP